MSCPLLEKLAPETRNLIYEYVLTFDTALKHAKNMQPFLQKLCKRTNSEAESTTSADPREANGSLQPVNISILLASKLIYTEAITIFYENNTVYFDASNCKYEDLVAPRATDLSLAKQVVVETNLGLNHINDEDYFTKFKEVLGLVGKGFQRMFPNLRACTVYIDTDATTEPAAMLFRMATGMRRAARFETVKFESLGLVTGSLKHLKFIVRYKAAMDRWAIKCDPTFLSISDLETLTARSLYQLTLRLENAEEPRLDELFFTRFEEDVVPAFYPDV